MFTRRREGISLDRYLFPDGEKNNVNLSNLDKIQLMKKVLQLELSIGNTLFRI
jgi:hypothetical protein